MTFPRKVNNEFRTISKTATPKKKTSKGIIELLKLIALFDGEICVGNPYGHKQGRSDKCKYTAHCSQI